MDTILQTTTNLGYTECSHCNPRIPSPATLPQHTHTCQSLARAAGASARLSHRPHEFNGQLRTRPMPLGSSSPGWTYPGRKTLRACRKCVGGREAGTASPWQRNHRGDGGHRKSKVTEEAMSGRLAEAADAASAVPKGRTVVVVSIGQSSCPQRAGLTSIGGIAGSEPRLDCHTRR